MKLLTHLHNRLSLPYNRHSLAEQFSAKHEQLCNATLACIDLSALNSISTDTGWEATASSCLFLAGDSMLDATAD